MTGHSTSPAATLEPPLFPIDVSPSWWQSQFPSPGWAPLGAEAHERVDICVVGAGVTGTSTAFSLARAGARVMLIDARSVAGGASGRNGGFLLAGLNVRYSELAERVGRDRAHALYRLTATGRDHLIETAAEVGVPEAARVTGSLRLAVDAGEIADLDREHALLEADGIASERLAPEDLPDGLGAHFLGGLRFPDDGASVPAAWVRGLARAAADAGAVVHEHSPVRAITADDTSAQVELVNGGRVIAESVVVCTEAYLPGLLPELRGLITPYRSQVLAANVGEGTARLLSQPTWSRRGWDYAQQTERGVVIAGGELVEDQSLYATWAEQIDDADQAMLEGWVKRVLAPGDTKVEVLQRWAGVLSISFDDLPIIGRLPGRERIICCGGWGGAGNVLGFVGGELVANLIAGTDVVPPEFAVGRIELR